MDYSEIRNTLRSAITNYYLDPSIHSAVEKGFVVSDFNLTFNTFYSEINRIIDERSDDVYDKMIMTDKIRSAFIKMKHFSSSTPVTQILEKGIRKYYLPMPWLNEAFEEHNAPYAWMKKADDGMNLYGTYQFTRYTSAFRCYEQR